MYKHLINIFVKMHCSLQVHCGILAKKLNRASLLSACVCVCVMIDVLVPGLNASLYCTSTHHCGKGQMGLWDVMGTHTRTILMSYCHTAWWQQPSTERVIPMDTQTASKCLIMRRGAPDSQPNDPESEWQLDEERFSNTLTFKEGLDDHRDWLLSLQTVRNHRATP